MRAHVHRCWPLAVVLIALGCATERGTGPPSPPTEIVATTKLAAMSILDDPIVAISEPIEAGRWPSDTFDVMYGVHLPTELPPGMERVDDVLLEFDASYFCCEISVMSSDAGGWLPVYRRHIGENCSVGEITWRLQVPLSSAGLDPAGLAGSVKFAGRGFANVALRYVQYHPSYAAATIAIEPFTMVRALTILEHETWIATGEYRLVGSGTMHDSILVFDSAGTRLRAFPSPPGTIYALEHHRDELWGLVDPYYSLARLSPEGHVEDVTEPFYLRSFICSWFCSAPPTDLASAMGRLWSHVDLGGEKLHGYLTDSSIAVGTGVYDWEFDLPDFAGNYGLAWDGTYFLVSGTSGWIDRVNLSGERVARYRVDTKFLGQLVWDGDALLAVHSGPSEFGNANRFLSRFRLPEVTP